MSWVLHTGKWPEQDQVVCHKCDNRKCVRPNHLFIGTQKDNFDDMVFKGRAVFARGEAKNFAKLTEVAVRAIRAAYRPGEVRHKDLAAQYGVSQGLISMILARKIWTHI